ncbi:MAG: PIG-L family deacetylase [Acidobacteriota bacterium]|nr:PIG-L family deacetylase [Blastocatellia bacterium]MDW8411975.1 PIG-L family deacetylase [Acidobacteriota bacterium]
MVRKLAAILIIFIPSLGKATVDVELYQALLTVRYPFTVMFIATHPGDEDSDGLAYFRMKYGAKTVLVVLTRGEGGENVSGSELDSELGILKMKELNRAAARLDTVLFSVGVPDFGPCKSAEEAFLHWDKTEVLRRLVYVIRLYCPEVVITTHRRDDKDGQHRATRMLIEQAIDMASDKMSFREQIGSGVGVWQVRRMFERLPVGAMEFDVEFDSYATEPVRGKKYAELAFQSQLEHRSQGSRPELPKTFERMIRYSLVKKVAGDRFRRWYRIDQRFDRPAVYDTVLPMVFADEDAMAVGLLPRAELSARLKRAINYVRDYRRRQGREDSYARILEAKLVDALKAALGFRFSAACSSSSLVQGQAFSVDFKLRQDDIADVGLLDLRVLYPEDWQISEPKLPKQINRGEEVVLRYSFKILPHARTVFAKRDLLEPQISAEAVLTLDGLDEPLRLTATLDVDVEPAVRLKVATKKLLFNLDDRLRVVVPIKVEVVNLSSSVVQGRLKVASELIDLFPSGVSLQIQPGKSNAVIFSATAKSIYEGVSAPVSIMLVSAAGQLLAEEVLTCTIARLTVPNVRVGYLAISEGSSLQAALELLGIKAVALNPDELGWSLAYFDTVILDSHVYLAYPKLKEMTSRLQDFMRAGGTLLVFRQRPEDWNEGYAPYRIRLGWAYVGDEASPVEFLIPEHPVLNAPNKISEVDFAGWVQERGLFFADSWSEAYSAILSMKDGEGEALKGGLLVASYGRGRYIYTSLSLHRQLRIGNAGAYRLLCNLVARP